MMPARRPRSAHVAPLIVLSLSFVAMVLAGDPLSVSRSPEDPTFAEDVAPILYRNCTSCHHVGGLGPFSLIEYDSAKANASDMRDMVSTGQMPPWHAEGPHGVFRNDRRLSEAEKQTILRWIDSETKPGDLRKLPARPVYPTKWMMGTPDAVVTMPEDYVVPASGTIEYQYFEIPTNITEDKWVQAIEIMPGAREVVHHVLVYAKVPPPPGAEQAAAATPRPAGTPAPVPVLIRNE